MQQATLESISSNLGTANHVGTDNLLESTGPSESMKFVQWELDEWGDSQVRFLCKRYGLDGTEFKNILWMEFPCHRDPELCKTFFPFIWALLYERTWQYWRRQMTCLNLSRSSCTDGQISAWNLNNFIKLGCVSEAQRYSRQSDYDLKIMQLTVTFERPDKSGHTFYIFRIIETKTELHVCWSSPTQHKRQNWLIIIKLIGQSRSNVHYN